MRKLNKPPASSPPRVFRRAGHPGEGLAQDMKIIATEGWAARFLFHTGTSTVKNCQTCFGYRRVFRRFAPLAWERLPCRCE
jgi:hypothetical protein